MLEPIFEDFKKYFLGYLLDLHYAHARMLAQQAIISRDEEAQITGALGGLDLNKILATRYDGTYEDLFFYIESLLEQAIGVDVAGKLHTARSRNDIAITLYRMMVRRELLTLASSLGGLRSVVLALAGEHLDTVMPAHTHTQPAQPTTLAHYLLAAAEFMGRDLERIEAAFRGVNLCPMGACAITTTGFPIDRDLTASLLGFEGLAENSYGAIAAIDYVTSSAAAVAVSMVNLGKFTQDLLLWSTREFGFLRLSDAFVQSSSIMPQKRNPVPLEHVRVLASRALGEAQAVLTTAHNTPFGDINDSEDDLQPLVSTMFHDAARALKLLSGALRSAGVDRPRLLDRARHDFMTVTELADTLVRIEKMSFREAHHLVAQAVAACGTNDSAAAMADAVLRLHPKLKLTREDIKRALDPRHFVEIRNIRGGPSPAAAAEALARAAAHQADVEKWLAAKLERVDSVAPQLRSR